MTVRGVFVGLATLDVVSYVDRIPGADEKVTATAQFVAAGGPAANAAVAFAALGGHATLVTAIGHSAAATVIRADLERNRVQVIDAATSPMEAPVSSIAVTSATGQRAVVGLDAAVSTTAVPDQLTGLIEAADIVLVDGHHRTLATAAAGLARSRGVPALLDAGRWKPVMTALIPLVDTVVAAAGFRLPGTTTIEDCAALLRQSGPHRVAFTQGAGPIHWWTSDAAGLIDVAAVVAIDTLGAGDILHGAYCRFATDRPFPAALSGAAAVATRSCTTRGTRAWIRELDPDALRPE